MKGLAERLTLSIALLMSLLITQELDAAFLVYPSESLDPPNSSQEPSSNLVPGSDSASNNAEWGSSELQTVLAAVTNLTASQNDMMNQQKVYQQDRQTQIKVGGRNIFIGQGVPESRVLNKTLVNRETSLLRTVRDQQEFMSSIQKRVSRKLRNVSKNKKGAQTSTGTVACGLNDGPKDCGEVYMNGDDVSGVYRVFPSWNPQNSFKVFCDMDTDGGGWTVIQRRGRYGFAENYFQKPWEEYKNGFGDLETEFWLGNNQVWALTNQGGYQIRYDIRETNSSWFVLYDSFWIESESQGYRLHVGKMKTGNASDILLTGNGQHFSTKDKNQRNCAESQKRAWWYDSDCDLSPQLGGNGPSKEVTTTTRDYRYNQYYSERDRQILTEQAEEAETQRLQELAEAESEARRWRQTMTELKIRMIRFFDQQ